MVMTVERTHSTSGNLALAAGAGVAAGFAANLIRKAVMQSPTALSGNWSDSLAAEHKMTLASFDKLEKTTPKQTTRRTMLLAHQAFAGQTCFSGRKRRLPLASGSWSRGGCGSPQQRAWICEAVSLRPSYDAQGRSRLDDQDPRVPEHA